MSGFYQPPNMPPIKMKPDEPLAECEERLYWQKRFNFAAWLFLFMGIWAIFASSTATSALIAIGVSFGFRIFNSICRARHMYWHMKNNGGDDVHL